MKKTILGEDAKTYKQRLKQKKLICVFTVIAMLCLNLLFTLLRTDDNHYLMLVLNISVDVLALWFLVGFVELHILPMSNILKIYSEPGARICGVISDISEKTERNMSIDCYRLLIDGRGVFLPEALKSELKSGDRATLYVASGVVTEVEL